MVAVFREVRRVLRDDGVLWLNLGDSYANDAKWGGASGGKHVEALHGNSGVGRGKVTTGLKPKDLVGIPWRVAFALQADGWYLRSDIIWSKPNPMPESVTDRPTKAHEYIFLLSKSERYYYDADAIAEPVAAATIERLSQPTPEQQAGSDRVPGKTNGAMKAVPPRSWKGSAFDDGKNAEVHPNVGRNRGPRIGGDKYGDSDDAAHRTKSGNEYTGCDGKRNRRTVWTVATQPYSGAHFAVFPPDLIRPCVLAGSRPGDVVLDPFNGSGTTGQVATEYGRDYIGIELNAEYIELSKRRLSLAPIALPFHDVA